MPGFDRTGPTGGGPMTGRQLGRCTGYTGDIPGRGNRFYGRGPGRGFRGGFGRGNGRGFGFRWGNPHLDYEPAASDETLLENEARTLRDQLSFVEKQLEQIKKDKQE